MESVGKYLRKKREERAMSVEEISRATRIPLVSIERLESDHFDDLPGEVFVRGFLKAYARAVGLGVEDVLARYTAGRRVAYVTPIPVMSPIQKATKKRFGVAIAFVVLLVLFTLALSIVLKPRGRDLPQEISQRSTATSHANSYSTLGALAERRAASRARPKGARLATKTHATDALVLRGVPFADADVVVTLFTATLGRVSAMARRARDAGSSRRTRLVVEPMHTLRVVLEERPNAELLTLRESSAATVRTRLTARLDALEAAGRALRWLRDLAPSHAPDAALWEETTSLLDALDAIVVDAAPVARLAVTGLRYLDAAGYGLGLDACVRCGKPCPEGAAALLAPAAGGIVCRACGGGPILVSADLRRRVVDAFHGGPALDPKAANEVLGWIDRALEAHAGR